MTEEALEIRRKLEYNISKLSVSGLIQVYEYSQMVLFGIQQSLKKINSEPQKKSVKKVLYNGRLLTEDTVKLMSWHKSTTDTDEEIGEKIWEYIQEKYK